MSMAVAAGYPQYDSDGTSQFIPALWEKKLLAKLRSKQVMQAISNTMYEGGPIKNVGDRVTVRTIPDGTIRDYVKGQDLIFEHLESTPVTLYIDHAKYYGTVLDDIDKYQSDLQLLNMFSEEYGFRMAETIDTHVLASIKAGAHADNLDNTAGEDSGDILLGASAAPFQITKATVIDWIVSCGVVLAEKDVPTEGCWMVVPPWFGGIIQTSDLKDASMTGDGKSVLRNGRIGIIWPFEIFLSNSLPTTASDPVTCWDIPFGHKMGLTYVSQFVKTETFKPEKTFGTAIKGLTVFGHKIMISAAIGCGYVRK